MGQTDSSESFQPTVVSSVSRKKTYFYLYDFFHTKVLEVQQPLIHHVTEYPSDHWDLKNVKITYQNGREEMYHNIRLQGTYEA